jgi:pimeloyl-ACP methyl ester carboxylesterase
MSVLARLGGGRLINKLTVSHGTSSDISADDFALMRRDYACARAMRAGRREAAQIIPALPTLRRLQADGTPDVPTICVQGGRVDRGMTTLRPVLNRVAAELMATAPRGRLVVVDQAGHLIPQECPAQVRDAILDVVRAAKAVH